MHGFFEMLIFFGFLAAVIIVPQVLKSRDRQRMFETMRAAYEKGQPVPPELVNAMTRPRGRDADILDYVPESAGARDLRRGVVWTALGLGFILMGGGLYAYLYDKGGAPEALASFAAIGTVPLCVGLAFLALWRFAGGRAAPVPPIYAAPPPAATYAPPPSPTTPPRPEI